MKTSYSNKYSINMVFVTKEKADENQEYITKRSKKFSNDNTGEIYHVDWIDLLKDNARKWSNNNPEAKINIWYDAKAYSGNQLENTERYIKSIVKDTDSQYANIHFRDIHSIPLVEYNPKFFDISMPIYLRIDLLKLILCHNSLTIDKDSATIFADLSITPQTKDALFSQGAEDNLGNLGIILGIGEEVPDRKHTLSPDNQFIEMVGDTHVVKSLKEEINCCFTRLLESRDKCHNQSTTHECIPFGGTVYELPAMILNLKNNNNILDNRREGQEASDEIIPFNDFIKLNPPTSVRNPTAAIKPLTGKDSWLLKTPCDRGPSTTYDDNGSLVWLGDDESYTSKPALLTSTPADHVSNGDYSAIMELTSKNLYLLGSPDDYKNWIEYTPNFINYDDSQDDWQIG